jgi:SAM-dependent methyltransferase
MGWNSLGLTHDFMARHVGPGAFCIDATAGRGRDTVLLARLAGPSGRVLALDIQPEAVEATRALALAEGVADRVEVRLMGHQDLDRCAAPGTADCVVFNLGWLPGASHGVFTTAETTLPALEKALEILKPGGVLSLCVYYGKENGYQERDAVLDWLRGLDPRVYNVLRLDFPNRTGDPPIPVFILKE